MIDQVEFVDGSTCKVHLCARPSDKVAPGDHNVFNVRLHAATLLKAIAEMDDGDVFDPWDLEMAGEE
jgi:hypothetical protein